MQKCFRFQRYCSRDIGFCAYTLVELFPFEDCLETLGSRKVFDAPTQSKEDCKTGPEAGEAAGEEAGRTEGRRHELSAGSKKGEGSEAEQGRKGSPGRGIAGDGAVAAFRSGL